MPLVLGRISAFMLMLAFFNKVQCFQCSQCDSDLDPSCYDNPPAPQNCTSCSVFDQHTGKCVVAAEVTSCIIEQRFINDTLIRVTRDCSPAMMRPTCNPVLEFTKEIIICFRTCSYSGCNRTNIGHSIYMSVTVMLICVILYSLLAYQNYILST